MMTLAMKRGRKSALSAFQGGNSIMWHTSRGDRTLGGKEAILICRAVDEMVLALLMHIHDEFEEEANDCSSGIPIYDACSPSQRIGLLNKVALHLLTETTDVLPLTALVDATIAAVFVEVRDQVAIEIGLTDNSDQGDPFFWRRMVLESHRSSIDERPNTEDEEQSALPLLDSDQLEAWEKSIDELADLILWDRDFEMADTFMDLDPKVSKHRRRLLGIDDHYFSAVANDPYPDMVFQLASETRKLVRAKPR